MARHSAPRNRTVLLVVGGGVILVAGLLTAVSQINDQPHRHPAPTVGVAVPHSEAHHSTPSRPTPSPSGTLPSPRPIPQQLNPGAPAKPFPPPVLVPLKLLYYTVQPGDTLIGIGEKFNNNDDYLPLGVWNESVIGKNFDLIKPGQVIIVREDKGRTPAAIEVTTPTPVH